VDVAVKVYKGSHAFISFFEPRDVDVAAELCQSFALDNGAFSAWKQGAVINWDDYYKWVAEWMDHPGFDFAVIPDVIDGTEEENDALLNQWPFRDVGAPVWHTHEGLDRLRRLADEYPRICLGSSGKFSQIGTVSWWERMDEAMDAVCLNGRPIARLHGLRMLDPRVFQHLPLSSGDSTNVARHHSEKRAGHYVIKQSIEDHNSCGRWDRKIKEDQGGLF